jgi:hypothetical protein
MFKYLSYTVQKKLLFSIYALFLLLSCLFSYKKPSFNWDMLPYTAITLRFDGYDKSQIHDQVYRIAKNQLSASDYYQLSASNPKRKKWHDNPASFNALLPFYVVKPLYNACCFTLYKCGIPLLKATVLPSIFAYFVCGIILYTWLNKFLKKYLVLIISVFTMLLPFVLEAEKLSTPDFLCAMFMIGGLYLMMEKTWVNGMFICFLFGILSRIDFVLPTIAILSALLFVRNTHLKITIKKYLLLTAITIAAYLMVAASATSLGWDMFYFPSFIKTLNTKGDINVFSLHEYLELVKAQLFTGLYFSHLMWFFLICTFIFVTHKGRKTHENSIDYVIMLVLIVTLFLRFIFHPVIADRFYLGYYIIAIVILAKRISIHFDRSLITK